MTDYQHWFKDHFIDNLDQWVRNNFTPGKSQDSLMDKGKVLLCMRSLTGILSLLLSFKNTDSPAKLCEYFETDLLTAVPGALTLYDMSIKGQFRAGGQLYWTGIFLAALHVPKLYYGDHSTKIGIKKTDQEKGLKIYETISPLAKKLLENILQELRRNTKAILDRYNTKGTIHQCRIIVKSAWKTGFSKHYPHLKWRKSLFNSGRKLLSQELVTIQPLVHEAFYVLAQTFAIDERCLNHCYDVFALCERYYDEQCHVPHGAWVSRRALKQANIIHTFLTKKESYRQYLPDADSATLEHCFQETSALIKSVLESTKRKLKRDIAHQATIAAANTTSSIFLGGPAPKKRYANGAAGAEASKKTRVSYTPNH